MPNQKKYTFWFHYNKPESTKQGKPQITIHYRETCYVVDNLQINVPTFGHLKKDQPKFVIKGYTKDFKIDENNVAYIN